MSNPSRSLHINNNFDYEQNTTETPRLLPVASSSSQSTRLSYELPEVLKPLRDQRNWVIWRYDEDNGRLAKVPYQGERPAFRAKSNKNFTWCDYETAVAAAVRTEAAGIGFMIKGSGIAAFDLDDCRDPKSGEVAPCAMELVQKCGSYTEITPSGCGLRIIGLGTGPETAAELSMPVGGGETYRDAVRFITMTFDVLPGTPQHLANIDAEMDSAVARYGRKQSEKSNTKLAAGKSDLEARRTAALVSCLQY